MKLSLSLLEKVGTEEFVSAATSLCRITSISSFAGATTFYSHSGHVASSATYPKQSYPTDRIGKKDSSII